MYFTQRFLMWFPLDNHTEVGYQLKPDGAAALPRVSIVPGAAVINLGDGLYEFPPLAVGNFQGRITFDSTETPDEDKLIFRIEPIVAESGEEFTPEQRAAIVAAAGTIEARLGEEALPPGPIIPVLNPPVAGLVAVQFALSRSFQIDRVDNQLMKLLVNEPGRVFYNDRDELDKVVAGYTDEDGVCTLFVPSSDSMEELGYVRTYTIDAPGYDQVQIDVPGEDVLDRNVKNMIL